MHHLSEVSFFDRRRGLRWPAAAGALVIALIALLVARGDPGDATLYPAAPGSPAVEVYVAYNGFHSGLTVPTVALLANGGPTAEAVRRLRPQTWTALGWGDAKFYQHQGWGLDRQLDIVRFLFWPANRTTAHVVGIDDPRVDAGHPHILRLRLTPAGFRALQRRADASFETVAGRPMFEVRGRGANDLFFRGHGWSNVLNECNQWTAALLAAGGVPHSRLLDTTADGLAFDLRTRAGAEVVHGPSPTPPPPARSGP